MPEARPVMARPEAAVPVVAPPRVMKGKPTPVVVPKLMVERTAGTCKKMAGKLIGGKFYGVPNG